MEDCLVKMTQLVHQLSPAEKGAVLHLLNHTAQMVGLTIGQTAQACGVGTTTIVRLCKRLGYKGFKDFSLAFSMAAAVKGHERIAFEDISPNEGLKDLIQKVTHLNQAAITDTINLLSEQALEKAVSLLHQAKRVDFYGVGMSALVAQDAQMKFLRLGKACQAPVDPHVQAVTAATLGPGDVAVLFSYSGETEDTLDTLAAARRSGAKVLSVTRFGQSRIAQGADIALFVPSGEMLVRSAAMSSRISMMHLIDLLFSAVATRGYEEYKASLERTHLEGAAKRRVNSKNGRSKP